MSPQKYQGELLPREKMLRLGKHSLSNSELLAIFLRTGSRDQHVLELAADLLAQSGSLDRLAGMEVQEILQQHKGIGEVKAITLAAAFELGKRAIEEKCEALPLNSPERIWAYLQPGMRWLSQEQLVVLLLNTKLHLIKRVTVSTGILNETLAHPRDILRPAILINAYAFILSHNHPSGDPLPSDADKSLTHKIAQAAKIMDLKFLDHLIIGKPRADKPGYFSFREEGLI